MPLFVTKFKIIDTTQAKLNKEVPARMDEAARTIEQVGGKLLGFFATLGDYDYVAISEVPDEVDAKLIEAGLEVLGKVRASTVKAFTTEQFATYINK